MKILQVVTFISPDGSYGGPARVAINQAKSLSALGHEVFVVAAAGGFNNRLPTEFDGYPVRLFPGIRVIPRIGFAGLTSPKLIAWLAGAVNRFDVVHIHLARDLVTLPAAILAIRAGVPVVAQTHGMIDESDKKLARPLDALITRPVLRRAKAVLYLIEREKQAIARVARDELRLRHVPNGVFVPEYKAIEQDGGPCIEPEVLYLARIHSIKRPALMVHAAAALEEDHPNVRFTLIGPDEGEIASVEDLSIRCKQQDRVLWRGPLPPGKTLSRMRQASLYVLPSSAEVFPMSVLEAMSLGLPVIVTDGCGLATTIQKWSAGIICGQTPEEFIQAVKTIIENPEQRISLGRNARRAVQEVYSMSTVAKSLLDVYEDL